MRRQTKYKQLIGVTVYLFIEVHDSNTGLIHKDKFPLDKVRGLGSVLYEFFFSGGFTESSEVEAVNSPNFGHGSPPR